MHQPPLHYTAPSSASITVKPAYRREDGAGPFERAAFRGPDSPLPYQSRAAGENHSAPPPTRDVAASVSSSAKTTK
jgi:hypothetical protein